jgi:glycosyltransferase involved in cell wall biosynthesis
LRIAFLYLPGRRARLAELSRGDAPSEFFYGAAELAAAGHTVEHFEFSRATSSPRLAAGLDLLRRAYLTPPKVFGHTFMNAWDLAPELAGFDCVVATVAHHGFALAACAAFGRMKTPLVTIQCGLLHQTFPPPRRAITRALLNRMHSVFFGEAEHVPAQAMLSPEPQRLSVSQFGVDAEFWSPGKSAREDFVLSIGNDTRRDFATLLAAAGEIAAPIRIVTRLPLPEPLPANVTVIRGSWHDRALSDSDIRDLYRRAACVVVPLHDSLQPSGQSVTLQAMACGAPVVLTQTKGLWNPGALREGKNVRLVRPGDAKDLAAAVRAILRGNAPMLGAAGREYVLAEAAIAGFAHGIGAACERAIAAP